MLTFVFSEDRKTSGYKTNYIEIDSFDIPVDFYEFVAYSDFMIIE